MTTMADFEAAVDAFGTAQYNYGNAQEMRRWHIEQCQHTKASLLALVAGLVKERDKAQTKANVLDSYATSRLCSDHQGKWQRGTCVMCDHDRLRAECEGAKKERYEAAQTANKLAVENSHLRIGLEKIIARYDGFTSAKEMVEWARAVLATLGDAP